MKHSNRFERPLLSAINEVRNNAANHRKLDSMRLAAIVPEPPTDHYVYCQWKWGLNEQDPIQKRKNWIAFLKSSDGAPYRVVPANKI